MVVMITRARVFGHRDVRITGTIFLAVAVAGSTLLGAVLAGTGELLERPARLVIGVITLAVIAAAASVRRRPWQLDRETNSRWLLYEDWRTAAYNAAVLGLGFSSRIGFWLFLLVPVGSFLTGDIRAGAAIYGSYAASRIIGSFIVAALSIRADSLARSFQLWQGRIRLLADVAFFACAGYAITAFATT